jgi:phosphate-selective porin OprO/OprP
VRGGSQHIASAALNWYLNPIMRVMFQYQHVTIDRLSPNAATYLTPVGAFVGQRYDDLAARFQFAF